MDKNLIDQSGFIYKSNYQRKTKHENYKNSKFEAIKND